METRHEKATQRCPKCGGDGALVMCVYPAASTATLSEHKRVMCDECAGTGRVYRRPRVPGQTASWWTGNR